MELPKYCQNSFFFYTISFDECRKYRLYLHCDHFEINVRLGWLSTEMAFLNNCVLKLHERVMQVAIAYCTPRGVHTY